MLLVLLPQMAVKQRRMKVTQEKELWVSPEVEDLDIAEKTQSGDGVNFDGVDPSFEDGS